MNQITSIIHIGCAWMNSFTQTKKRQAKSSCRQTSKQTMLWFTTYHIGESVSHPSLSTLHYLRNENRQFRSELFMKTIFRHITFKIMCIPCFRYTDTYVLNTRNPWTKKPTWWKSRGWSFLHSMRINKQNFTYILNGGDSGKAFERFPSTGQRIEKYFACDVSVWCNVRAQ